MKPHKCVVGHAEVQVAWGPHLHLEWGQCWRTEVNLQGLRLSAQLVSELKGIVGPPNWYQRTEELVVWGTMKHTETPKTLLGC